MPRCRTCVLPTAEERCRHTSPPAQPPTTTTRIRESRPIRPFIRTTRSRSRTLPLPHVTWACAKLRLRHPLTGTRLKRQVVHSSLLSNTQGMSPNGWINPYTRRKAGSLAASFPSITTPIEVIFNHHSSPGMALHSRSPRRRNLSPGRRPLSATAAKRSSRQPLDLRPLIRQNDPKYSRTMSSTRRRSTYAGHPRASRTGSMV